MTEHLVTTLDDLLGQISNSFKDFEMDVESYDASYEDDLKANLL